MPLPDNSSTSSSATRVTSMSKSSMPELFTDQDKESFTKKLKTLDKDSFWKLSTGEYVEEKIYEYGIACEEKSSEDIEELQSFGSKPVPGIDDNLGHYLKNLPISEDIHRCHEQIATPYISPVEAPAKYWAKKAIVDTIDLYHSKFFDSNAHSERDQCSTSKSCSEARGAPQLFEE
ncbi:unnamed protein product [Mucor fragilis]